MPKKKTTRKPAKKKTTKKTAKPRTRRKSLSVQFAQANPTKRIKKSDIVIIARLAIHEAIHKANRDRFFNHELGDTIFNWTDGGTPTAQQMKWFKDEINKWLDKVWPPELPVD